MSKAGLTLVTIVILVALTYWWAGHSTLSVVSQDAIETTPLVISAPVATSLDPSPRHHIELVGDKQELSAFSIVIDDELQWDFSVTNRQSHPNGDFSYSGRDNLGATALVTRGQRRMYASVSDGSQLIEISSDASGEIIEWKEIGPDDVPLDNDYVVEELLSVQHEGED